MTTTFIKLPRLPVHDPSGGSDMCTIKVPLPDGVSLLQTSYLTACDKTFAPLSGTDFELLNVEVGLIADSIYGANFWPYRGSGLTEVIITLTPYYSDSLPGKAGEDISVLLPIGKT